MCAGYELDADPEAIARAFRAEPAQLPLPLSLAELSAGERYPRQQALIVVTRSLPDGSSVRRLGPARFGLTPHFAKELREGDKHFNARAETVHERPLFRVAFERRRCLVPVTAFFEWLRAAPKKAAVRYRYQPSQGGMLALAGIWDNWRTADGDKVASFAIITTEANAQVAQVHPRMPAILASEQAQALWLTREADPDRLRSLLLPAEDGLLRAMPG
jgi:putative SOS response-associated peptidase YedK